MFLTEKRKYLPLLVGLLVVFSAAMLGCGLRSSQTGSLSSRIIDADGNAVMNAEVFSIFRESEKVYTAADGGFYLSELPAGLNNIVILHPDYLIEERQIEIQSNETTVIETIRLDKSNAPHKISNIRVIETASTSATIRWNTYRSVLCTIDYGSTRSYGAIYREERPTVEHEAVIEGLSPETLYHFRVQYIDDSNVVHYSYDYSFMTEMGDQPSAPLSISVLPIKSAGVVDMTWQSATGTSVIGYNIYRMEKGGDWLLLNERPVSARTNEYSDETANPGRFTRYAVVAVNEFTGESYKVISDTVFVPGVINESVKIEYLDSPIDLNSDLVVAAGTTLDVASGVVFRIGEEDLAGSGMDEKRVELLVSGRLLLNGTADRPVKFTALNGSGFRDHWAGIKILSSNTGVSKLNQVRISGCKDFAIDVEAQRLEMSNISVAYCENGIRLNGLRETLELDSVEFAEITGVALQTESCRKVWLKNSLMKNVNTGIISDTTATEDQLIVSATDIYCQSVGITGVFGRSTIVNVLIVCPGGTGISMNNVLHNYENYVDHCTLEAFNGIEIASGTVTIENNIFFSDNGNIGINNSSLQTPVYEFNNVFGFSEKYRGCGPGVGGVSVNPEFIGGNPFDYDLRPESSLNLQDRFGSEMGRYGVSRL
ncbi:MAG: hypothetical protein PWR01_3247 [Clostridiales bacterium]|jgi:hypothetical protein|nr:hypothetical protein [Clostridiales bacterium]MDN5282174.1 hypothetical protein [Candidatus Ozemobacter sp.]